MAFSASSRRASHAPRASGALKPTGETTIIACDQVFKAIGQQFVPAVLNGSSEVIGLEAGRIKVDAERRTSPGFSP